MKYMQVADKWRDFYLCRLIEEIDCFFLCDQHFLHESLGSKACCGSSNLILPTFGGGGVVHGFLFPEVDRPLCVLEFYLQSVVVRGFSSSIFIII
jgi:hypothetical protein